MKFCWDVVPKLDPNPPIYTAQKCRVLIPHVYDDSAATPIAPFKNLRKYWIRSEAVQDNDRAGKEFRKRYRSFNTYGTILLF